MSRSAPMGFLAMTGFAVAIGAFVVLLSGPDEDTRGRALDESLRRSAEGFSACKALCPDGGECLHVCLGSGDLTRFRAAWPSCSAKCGDERMCLIGCVASWQGDPVRGVCEGVCGPAPVEAGPAPVVEDSCRSACASLGAPAAFAGWYSDCRQACGVDPIDGVYLSREASDLPERLSARLPSREQQPACVATCLERHL